MEPKDFCFEVRISNWDLVSTGGYVGETRAACGHTLWSSAWAGKACPPFVQQGCPLVERSEPGGRAAIIHISTGSWLRGVRIQRRGNAPAARRLEFQVLVAGTFGYAIQHRPLLFTAPTFDQADAAMWIAHRDGLSGFQK